MYLEKVEKPGCEITQKETVDDNQTDQTLEKLVVLTSFDMFTSTTGSAVQ